MCQLSLIEAGEDEDVLVSDLTECLKWIDRSLGHASMLGGVS